MSKYVVRDIYEIDPIALGQMASFWEANPFRVPIAQVTGFTAFQANNATVATSETTTSTTYTNLTTTGPTIASLSKGKYVVFLGSRCANNTSSADTFVSLSINSDTAVDSRCAMFEPAGNGQECSVMRALATDLTLDSNTLQLKYRVQSGTGTFQDRWIIAVKYANIGV